MGKNTHERQIKIFGAYKQACIHFHKHSNLIKDLTQNFQTFFRQYGNTSAEPSSNATVLEHIKSFKN